MVTIIIGLLGAVTRRGGRVASGSEGPPVPGVPMPAKPALEVPGARPDRADRPDPEAIWQLVQRLDRPRLDLGDDEPRTLVRAARGEHGAVGRADLRPVTECAA